MFNILIGAALFVWGAAATCRHPKIVASTIFTTTDAGVLTHAAFIAQFSVKCDKTSSGGILRLYFAADDTRDMKPVSVIAPNRYQISWTEPIRRAQSGTTTLKIYDEDGMELWYRGEITSPEIGVLIVDYPGPDCIPWLSARGVALAISAVFLFLAATIKLQAQ